MPIILPLWFRDHKKEELRPSNIYDGLHYVYLGVSYLGQPRQLLKNNQTSNFKGPVYYKGLGQVEEVQWVLKDRCRPLRYIYSPCYSKGTITDRTRLALRIRRKHDKNNDSFG
jgi:hypothetical protein